MALVKQGVLKERPSGCGFGRQDFSVSSNSAVAQSLFTAEACGYGETGGPDKSCYLKSSLCRHLWSAQVRQAVLLHKELRSCMHLSARELLP